MSDAARGRERALTRLIPAALYHASTEPGPFKRWFAPRPCAVAAAELDVRPGGGQRFVMVAPDGAATVLRGVYLEVAPASSSPMPASMRGSRHPSRP